MEELRPLPQIVAGYDDRAARGRDRAVRPDRRGRSSGPRPLEAELTKIFTNVWRYIQFATANQFFMIATDYGLDFYQCSDAIPRLSADAGLPGRRLRGRALPVQGHDAARGVHQQHFPLGHAAMLINEGLPNFVVRHLSDAIPA